MCKGETPTPVRPGTPPSGTQPCPDCNCCVTSAAIGSVTTFFGATGFVSPNTGSTLYNGHAFNFRIEMTFSGGASSSDCVLEWWEKVNIPAVPGHQPNTWMDLYSIYSQSPTLAPWVNRTVPCPGGGNLTVTITDPPSLGRAPGRTLTRTLEFRLVVRSGSSCPCAITSATATATQVLVMVNGVMDANASSFTIGASSTTP